MGRFADLVPTNWCDPLLTGPKAVLPGGGIYAYDGQDVERLLLALKERIAAAEAEADPVWWECPQTGGLYRKKPKGGICGGCNVPVRRVPPARNVGVTRDG